LGERLFCRIIVITKTKTIFFVLEALREQNQP